LAIAAAKLGAGHVTAVELDEDAAASALGNIRANDAMDRIDLIHGDILDAGLIRTKAAYRIITANLTSGILKLLLPRFAELLAADGVLILSGILDAQEDGLRESLENTGYHASYIGRKGEWIAIEAARGFCFCIG
jgi:ribosomal protein L11 methyltransferase